MFYFMAEELREIMAQLGFRRVDDMIGQVQYLETRAGPETLEIQEPKSGCDPV